jgi:tetratricopeptide (TPR) repeat protein
MNTTDNHPFRARLTELNTKAYYLLVALSFVYRTNPTLSLKLAITLTALVAVLPVQDLLKSDRALCITRRSKALLLTLALGFALWWVWSAAAAPAAAAQKPAPPQPTEQQKPKESAGDFESRLKAAQEKADHAERAQQEAKDYYEKAFQTQVKFLDWFVILVAATPLVVGLFGFRLIDRTIEHSVSKATTDLERKFDQKLGVELKNLKESNAAQMKQLEQSLKERIDNLEGDLNCRVYYHFYSAQGQAAGADGRHAEALDSFRRALKTYTSGKSRQLFTTQNGGRTIRNILVSIEHLHPDSRAEEARKELANELYNDLEDEIAHGAGGFEWLSALVREKLLERPAIQETYPSPEGKKPQQPPNK